MPLEDVVRRLKELETRTAKYQKDIYEGNGKQALMVRVAIVEDALNGLSKSIDTMARNQNKAMWLCATTLVTAVVGVLVKLAK